MGYIIEVSDSKVEKLSEHAGKALKHIGKLMECVEEISDGADRMGERDDYGRGGRYGDRYDGGRYGNRYGNRGGDMGWRDDEDWEDDDDPYMGERRGRSRRTGRYVRR